MGRTDRERRPRSPADSAWLNAGGQDARPRTNSSWLTAEAEKPPSPAPPTPPPLPTYVLPTSPQYLPPPPAYAPIPARAPTPAPVQQPSNGLATASMVLGVINVVGVITILLSACAVPLAIVGLILGFVALRRPGGRRRALAGVIMNGLISLLSLLIALLGLSLLGAIFTALAGAAVSP